MDNITKLTNREIDKSVATTVMGWKIEHGELGHEHFTKNGEIRYLPFYSTNISDAWKVIDKLKDNWTYFNLFYEGEKWKCDFGRLGFDSTIYDQDTPQMAICLAALKAVGHID